MSSRDANAKDALERTDFIPAVPAPPPPSAAKDPMATAPVPAAAPPNRPPTQPPIGPEAPSVGRWGQSRPPASPEPPSVQAAASQPTPDQTAQARAVLALIAAAKQGAFLDHARGAATAEQVGARVTLADAAAAEQNHCALARRRLKEFSADPLADMAPVIRILTRFDAAQAASDWWEQLLSSYLSHAVAIDLQRMLITFIHPVHTRQFDALVSDCAGTQYERALLIEAVSKQSTLADRLSLWGRRVAGDAMAVAGQVVTELPGIFALASTAWPHDPARQVHSQLSAAHSRRMSALGLAG